MSEPLFKRWYKTARWQRLRARQLYEEPLCRFHRKRNEYVTATVCDHVNPHRGDEELFWSGPFQSLCANCHNSDKKRIENGNKPKSVIGADGWPTS